MATGLESSCTHMHEDSSHVAIPSVDGIFHGVRGAFPMAPIPMVRCSENPTPNPNQTLTLTFVGTQAGEC